MNASSNALQRTAIICFLLVVAVLWATTSVSAGTIQSIPAPVGSGTGLGTVAVPAIFTLSPANDDVAIAGVNDNNIFVPVKKFNQIGYIDIVFTVAPDNGVTEYNVFESVDNNTGTNWLGYEMSLGFGSGIGFSPSLAGDGLDFDAPFFLTPPTSSVMLNVVASEDLLTYSNGVHASGAESYQFRIDVPNLVGAVGAPATFTLRQVPITVPEPSTLVLLGMALAGVMAYRSRG